MDAIGRITKAFFVHFGTGVYERVGPELPWGDNTKAEFDAIKEAWETRLAQLGRDGWELVAVSGNDYIFKRRLG